MKYDRMANPAQNFAIVAKKIVDKAEELGIDKVEFINSYIEYLNALKRGEEVEIDKDIALPANAGQINGFIDGLITYLNKKCKALNRIQLDKEKAEKEKEGVIEKCKILFDDLTEKAPDLDEKLKQLKKLLEEKKKKHGKTAKIIVEEIEKEIKRTEEEIRVKRVKERANREIRDKWYQDLSGLINETPISMSLLNNLRSTLEGQEKKGGEYKEIIIEEINRAIRYVEGRLAEEREETEKISKQESISRNRQYLMDILYFTNGFVTIAQESLLSESGRTFSLDIDEYERFSKLNGEVRRELKGTEEEQIKSLIKKKILSLPAEDRTRIVQEIEEVLEDKMCEEMLFDMKMTETKYRSAKRTLGGWYKMALPHNQERAKENARKDLRDAEERKKDLEVEDSPEALKLNKVLASGDIATDILVLKLREREIERRKPRYAGEGR